MWSTSLFIFSLLGIGSTHNIFYRTGGSDISNGFVSSQDPKEMVQKFLARISRSIESKDVSIISGLFQPGFVFKGCRGTYDKQKIVQILSNIPSGTKFSMTLKSAEDQGSSIKYTVSATGFDKSEITAEFVLNKIDQQLESGNIPKCPLVGRSFAGNFVVDFINRLSKGMESSNATEISKYFYDDFLFIGCNGKYNKEQVVGILGRLLTPGKKIPLPIKYAKYISSDIIEYSATISEFGAPFEAKFFLSATYRKLYNGEIPSCADSSVIGQSLGFHSLKAEDTAEEQATKFIERMIRSVRSEDKAVILGLFEPDFTFKGCLGTYDKSQSVSMLMLIPSNTDFKYKIKSAKDNGNSINCVVLASGMGQTEVEFDFVLNKADQQLESAFMPVCPFKSHQIVGRSFEREESDVVVSKFLTDFEESMASGVVSQLESKFDDNFVFKGCRGNYDKATSVKMLLKFPEATSFFSLKSSHYNNKGQIEYTVTISIPDGETFDSDFVLCPFRKVLISANRPSCPAARSFY